MDNAYRKRVAKNVRAYRGKLSIVTGIMPILKQASATCLRCSLRSWNVELMNADTETNIDVARTRAERLIQEGANVLVGPFDSGAAAAIAQVAEQRGVPFVINIAAAPPITEQGYKFVFRNFPTAIDLTVNGLGLIGDLFRATNEIGRAHV